MQIFEPIPNILNLRYLENVENKIITAISECALHLIKIVKKRKKRSKENLHRFKAISIAISSSITTTSSCHGNAADDTHGQNDGLHFSSVFLGCKVAVLCQSTSAETKLWVTRLEALYIGAKTNRVA